MKPPTEADLIELENTALRQYREIVDNQNGCFTRYDRVVSTLEYLIARARFHNHRQSQRSRIPEPATTVQPKP